MGSQSFKRLHRGLAVLFTALLLPHPTFAATSVDIFNKQLMLELQPGTVQESLKEADRDGTLQLQAGYLYLGHEVCRLHAKGLSKKKVIKEITPLAGEQLTAGIYKAAVTLLCPQEEK